MIPLILLALGLGAALTVYELSPRTRSRVDVYVRAIRSANAAHQAADTHLRNANVVTATAARHARQANATRQATPRPAPTPPPVQPAPMTPPVQWEPLPQWASMQPTSPPTPVQPAPMPPAPTPIAPTVPMPEPAPAPLPPPPQDVANAQANAAQAAADAAVEHAASAIEANQDAAKNTAEAAKSAQTAAEKQAAADSAAKVLERERKIAAELKSLGVGQCGVRSYPRITERSKNALLAKLRAEGMGVTGDNPWNIDTRQYGVRLRAVWDPNASVVKLIVTTGKGTAVDPFGLVKVTYQDIWDKINPIMKAVIG